MKKTTVLLLISSLVLTLLSGCGSQSNSSGAGEDQPPSATGNTSSNDKMKITIECQHSHVRNDFEASLEEQFPNVDIVLNYNYSKNVLYSLQQSLSHDMTPDIYMCEFLPNLGDDTLSEYFYDMAAESFVNRYYLNAIEGCSTTGGGLYYLPGPSYVYGILYDKTAFDALGLSLPSSYSEFAALCKKINDMQLTGQEPDPEDSSKMTDVPVQAFVPTIMWPDMFQIIFNTMNYESSFQGVKNARWLADYQAGKGSAAGHLEPAAEKFLKLFDDGILSLDYWKTEPFYRTLKLYQYHTSLMTIECQQGFEYNETYGSDNPDNHHEMGIMPIYTSDGPDSGYLYGIPRSYFSITKDSAQDPEKLEAMLEIMDYLSTVEGQKKLISGPDYFGFLKNDSSVSGPLYSEVETVIENDRVIPTFFLGGKISKGKVENYLHGSTPDLVNGLITTEEWLKGADEVRDNLLKPEEQKVYGTVSETLAPIQSAYVEAESLLHSMDADIGYILVDQDYGTTQPMFSGDITDTMISFLSPEISSVARPVKGDMDYVVVEMTGRELVGLAQKIHPDRTGTFALAGVEMEVDLNRTGAEQYLSLKIDGRPMDMDKTYRVASLRGAVAGYKPVDEYKDLTFEKIFLSYLKDVAKGTITPPAQLTLTADSQ